MKQIKKQLCAWTGLVLTIALSLVTSYMCDTRSDVVESDSEIAEQEFFITGSGITSVQSTYQQMEVPEQSYQDGYISPSKVNIRQLPSTDSEIIGTLNFNDCVSYTAYNDEWIKIKYGEGYGYVVKEYISDTKNTSTTYSVPTYRGNKSWMGYRSITSTGSPQYKLQHSYAYTGTYGIRQVNGRYCIALGSYFNASIGQYVDLILKNGTVIPCVVADAKADKDTDASNIFTRHSVCCSEFVVDSANLNSAAKTSGNISSCTDAWNSPVAYITVYDYNILK